MIEERESLKPVLCARRSALEFQLGAEILSTATAPGRQKVGKLGAIVIIRTALNHRHEY